MNPFTFLSPQKVIFGWGCSAELGKLVSGYGTRCFLVDGSRTLRNTPHFERLMQSLREAGVEVEPLTTTSREPTVEDVDEATQLLIQQQPQPTDIVLGVGGGAALDLAKAAAAMALNAQGRSVRDFLEGVGSGAQLEALPLRMIAVPTTAGTGSEATKNAVISVTDPRCKKSLRSDKMVPIAVLIDPQLTASTSPEQTATCGLDAITQLLESYVSRRKTPLTQAIALEGLRHAVPALTTAYRDPADRAAREAMSYAAYLSGLALANSGLGMAHGVAAALGAEFDIPHGLACAVMLPVAMSTNREAAEHDFGMLGRALSAQDDWSDAVACEWLFKTLQTLLRELKIPRQLSDLGVTGDALPALVQGARGNSMNGNPRSLTDDELYGILEAIL